MNAPRFVPPYPYAPGDYPEQPPPPAPPFQPAKRRRAGSKSGAVAFVLAALSLCLLGLVATVVIGAGSDGHEALTLDASVPATTTEPAPPTPTAAAPAAPVVLNEGTYEVAAKTSETGGTIAAGKWKIRTPRDGVNCYWARLRNFDGQIIGSVIANGNVAPGATAIVNVKRTDAGLELRGDCEARK